MFKRKNDLLKGPVLSELLLFSLPLFLTYLFQHLYNIVDTVIVGNHLGEMSLAAIGASIAVYQLLIGFGFSFGNGFGIVVSRCFGSEDEDLVKKSVAGSLIIGAGIILIITLISAISLKPLLILLRTPPEILELTYDYIYIITMFTGISFIYNLTSGFLRSIGNSTAPLVFLVFASLLNIVLDIVFVIEFNMGIEGAAIATVISQGIATLLSVVYIWQKEHILIPEKKHFNVGINMYKELLGQGLSMAMMISFVFIGTIILQYAINQMGYMIIAAHTTARRVISLFMMPMTAITIATSTFISQNKGANNGHRILEAFKYANIICMVYSVVITAVTLLLSEEIIHLISGSDHTIVLTNGSNYLKFNVPFFIVVGLLFVTRYALQGIGEKLKPLISSIMELVLKFVFVILVIPVMGYTGVIISEPIIWIFMTIQLLYSFYNNPYIVSIRHKSSALKS